MKRNQNRQLYLMPKLIVFFSSVFITTFAFAQSNYSNSGNSFYGSNETPVVNQSGLFNNMYVGLKAGGTIVLGTLRDKPYSWAVGASLGKQLNSKFDIQTSLITGKMHAEGFWGGLDLSNDVNFTDASLLLKLKLKDLVFRNSPAFLNEMYLLGGVGLTFYNSKVINTADTSFVTGVGWDPSGNLKTKKIMSPFVPLGFGLSFNVDKSGRYFLTTEFTYYYSNNNQLDGDLNPTHASHYAYTSLGFVYKLGTNASSTQKPKADNANERAKPIVKRPIIEENPAKENIAKSETGNSENGLLNNWYAGLNVGATTMLATLREKTNSWAFGAVLGKQLNRKIGVQANLLNGKMHMQGLYSGEILADNVNFTDISLLLKLNLNDVVFTKSPKILRELYLFGGSGFTFFDSKVINTADLSFVTGEGWANDSTKTSRIRTPFFPIGIGMSFNLGKSERVALTTEFTYRYSNDNKLDGGLTTHAAHYTYASLGFIYNIGKTSFTTQQISSDVIEEKVTSSVVKQVKGEISSIVQEELKPVKEELSTQSKAIASIQSEVESRINALKQSIQEGVVTTKMADGTMQVTPISMMGAGATPSIASVYFAFNSLYITPDMQREIAVIARIMKKNRNLKCEITGNASQVGSPEYNLILSRKRANAVASFLSNEFGIEYNRLLVKSNGLTDPLAKNLHKINRRVDMQLFW